MASIAEKTSAYLNKKNRWVEFPIQNISAIPDYVPGSEKLRIYFMWDDTYSGSGLAYPDYPDSIQNSRYRTPIVDFSSPSIKNTWFNAVGDTVTFYGGSYLRCNRINVSGTSSELTAYGKNVKYTEVYMYNPSGTSVSGDTGIKVITGGEVKTSSLPTHMSQANWNLGGFLTVRMTVENWDAVLNAWKALSEGTSSLSADNTYLKFGIRRNCSYDCVYNTEEQDRLSPNSSERPKSYPAGSYGTSTTGYTRYYNFLVGLGEGTMKKGNGEGTGETTSNNNPSKPSGGQGDFDGSYDTDPSDKDSTDDLHSPSIKAGLRTYILDETAMQGFHDFMFADAFNNTWDSIRKVFGKPQDCIIGFNALFIPDQTNAPAPLTIGNIPIGSSDAPVVAGIPTSQWVRFDCGTISVKEAWGGFLDYPPYTTASLYLPFCGTIELPVDEIMNADVSVTYNIDITTGSCVASVYSERVGTDEYSPSIKATIARTQGNIGMQIPWSAADASRQWAAIGQIAAVAVATSVSFGTAAVAGAAAAEAATTTAAAGVATGAAAEAGAAATATNVASKATGAFIRNAGVAGATIASNIGHIPYTTVTRGGTAQNVFGVLQYFTPYLLITRPIQSYPQNYQHYHGLPSNITSKIGDLDGYTQVAAIELDDISGITPTEIAMLHETLTTGFYI